MPIACTACTYVRSYSPSDSTLLSNCNFKFSVSLLLIYGTDRCFCAGNEAHRFNFVPLFVAEHAAIALDDRMRRPIASFISPCDTDRWTYDDEEEEEAENDCNSR